MASRAVLFGSVAKGTATEKSDLDLLVDSKLQGLKFVGFMEAVRQAVGMPVCLISVRWENCAGLWMLLLQSVVLKYPGVK